MVWQSIEIDEVIHMLSISFAVDCCWKLLCEVRVRARGSRSLSSFCVFRYVIVHYEYYFSGFCAALKVLALIVHMLLL